MKNSVSKVKSLTTNKTKSPLPKTSKVQKTSIVKKKPTQIKMKTQQVGSLASAKEKLVGKNYSPTVEKAKSMKQIAKINSSPAKKKSADSPNIVQTATTKKSRRAVKQVDTDSNKSSAKTNKKETEKMPIEEKPIVKKEKPVAGESKVKKQKDEVKTEVNKGTKRKLKSENTSEPTKKQKQVKKDVKVENEATPEQKPFVSKPRQAKMKRKSSTTSVKDLKPISNIKTLVKKPQPKLSKAQIMKKLNRFPERGVCYFSHLPHGFYEKELEKYCSQFGKVTGVYHPVSKQGNSRGYAFVEFQHKEVAEVVAETMNNYLMFNRLLKCQYIPPEAQRPWVFKKNRDNQKEATLRRRENLKTQMRNLTKPEVKKWKERRLARVSSMHKKLAELGVDYEFEVNNTCIS